MFIEDLLNYFKAKELNENTLAFAQDIWNAIRVFYTKKEKQKKKNAYNILDELVIEKLSELLNFELSKYTWDKILKSYKQDNTFEVIKDIAILDTFVEASYEKFDTDKKFLGVASYQISSSKKEAWNDITRFYFAYLDKDKLSFDISKFSEPEIRFDILNGLLKKINEIIFLDSGIQNAISLIPNEEISKPVFSYNENIKVFLNYEYWQICEKIVQKDNFDINMIINYESDKYSYFRINSGCRENELVYSSEKLKPKMWKFSHSVREYVDGNGGKSKIKK